MVNSTPARRATTLPDDHEPKPVDRRPTVPEEHDYDSKGPEPSQKAPQLYLKDGEVEAFRHLAHSIVSRTLAHECEFRQLGCPEPNSKDWKLLKRQDDLSVYKQRVNEEASRSSKTYIVKCVGTLEGTLEDLLYGTHSKTRDEMHATAAFLHHSYMDCAVLNVLDNGTDDNPYRQLALKWFIAETFGDARLVKHRDWFNVESTGMGTDSFGRRYGYFLAKFADHPGCPSMPEDSDVIRGRMNMCCIYRQEPGSKVVDVYAKGSMDLGGGMPAFVTSSSSCAMMFSMAVSMTSAEAKRLTKLYLQHAQRKAEMDNARETEEELERSVTDLLTASVISSSAASSTDGIKLSKRSKDPCNVCGKKPAMAKLVRASHRKCGICRERVCSKCNTKRKLVGASGPVAMACCKICILASKRLHIDPREPCPILPSKIKG
ncbi:hypothetical protein DVH05_002775 [Phytophthora capsici]|nr:hypothetical protein DVH05_011151 [Phytophthora capsici]KAG1689137.1 hypothetical protein DVH05_002775 [Phytophthora capsici]